jgi:mycothiol synthase
VTDVEVHARLTPAEVAEVQRLVDVASDADGVHPLSEHVTLHLTHGGDREARNLLVRADGRLAAYAHLDTTDRVAGASAELVVAPDLRGRGIARELTRVLLTLSPDGRLRLWAHGNHPAADALAASLGFRRTRVLWQMRRSLYAPLPAPVFPDGVTVRTFVVGRDEQAWVEVNNRAFADHPDQGGWTVADLQVREREPWFDPAGFFLAEAEPDGRLAGFHWTKVHGGRSHGDHDHEPIGEVYVVGVDPSAQGQGLGPALTLVGLRHLRAHGLSQVMLYVDETNTNAIWVYERLGFIRWDTDICYQRP